MSANLFKTGTSNAFNTTLSASIDENATTIALTSVEGLQAPGVIVIDRQDANDEDTPTIREYISFTGIDGSSLTGCARGLGGSTAQQHNSSAKVEENWSITHWNDFLDTFGVAHDSGGNIVVSSTATIATARVYTHLNASGASITGDFPIRPVWVVSGAVSLATTTVGKPLPVDRAGEWAHFSVTVRTAASTASMIIDINKNGTSIFSSGYEPTIVGNGTFASTASIATKAFSAGDFFTVDIDAGGGLAEDLIVTGLGK